ncbi:unnamed protein product [Gongylonema pulchrum]|uniref:AT-hook motif nuclear-localized protein n=1 Tax=Gongylonema pulchrum TaxID=637853 RepID=A0A183E6R5_9BILA|nr:unnamed protein product [Gongylonema pulchrum]
MANKNQAMGDTQSDAEPGKSPSPTTSPHTVNNSGMQKQPTTPKFDVKSINPKTHQTRALPDNTRRGIDGIFYMGRGHRGVINSSSRPFSFTPRAIWHPQPNNTNVRRSEASGNSIQHASGAAAAASDPAANGGGNNQNAGDCVRTPKTVRSPVTRTFLNAALRGGRNWRGNAAAAAARSNQNNTARTDSSSRQVNTARQVTFSESTTQVSSAEPTIVEAQLPGIKREPRQRQNNYPLLYVSASGTISVVLEKDLIVEMSVDRAIRVSCVGKFAVSSSRFTAKRSFGKIIERPSGTNFRRLVTKTAPLLLCYTRKHVFFITMKKSSAISDTQVSSFSLIIHHPRMEEGEVGTDVENDREK